MADVLVHCTEYGQGIDPKMAFKTLVFESDDRYLELLRDRAAVIRENPLLLTV
jgi:hypothetical protein